MDEADEDDGFEVLDGSEVVGVVAPGNAPPQGGLLGALVPPPPPPPPIPQPHGAPVPVHPGPVVVMGNSSASATPDPEPEQEQGN
jgi:hypothetical protein